MKLSKIDLSQIVAVGHSGEKLGLLIDRGEEVEYLEISAPRVAYQGLKQVEALSLPPEDSKPQLQSVESSCAAAIGYDRDRQLLQIEFVSKSVYEYENVDEETWKNLVQSDSVGKFYNSQIKGGKYRSRRVRKIREI